MKKFNKAGSVAVAALTMSSLIVTAAGAAQGMGGKGDIDSITPKASIAWGGSSFSAPFMNYLANRASAGAYVNPNATFGTNTAAGSGDGRTGVAAGTYNIGFSDQPISTFAGTVPSVNGVAANPADFVQIPVALGGAVVAYNLSGIDNLKLSANVISAIYNGTVTKWNDATIAKLNPGVTLPDHAIVVEYRAKSSGTTYAFTDYLAKATAGKTPTGASGAVMEGTGAKWGATNVNGVSNNAGMATSINSTPGAIGYLEYSYVLTPGNHIQTASLQDAAGEWLTPSLKNIAAAAAANVKTITTDDFSITYQPGKGVWPFATYTWAIVKAQQTNAAAGELAVKFLDYAINGGQSYANANGFVALPGTVSTAGHKALLNVKAGTTVLLSLKK